MSTDTKQAVAEILARYDPQQPGVTTAALRDLWLETAPKNMVGLTAADKDALSATGTPVALLTEIGKAIGKQAHKRVRDFLPLAHQLWDEQNREGRIVVVHVLGAMELAAPELMVPVIYEITQTCLAWEDCDQLAMNALEPIVRKQPEQWLPVIEPWLTDDNKWVRRASVTVVGRLAMKQPDYTVRCLALTERLLWDEDRDVRRAVSFALRLCVRGEVVPVRDFLGSHVPPQDPAATWVLCDAIRSMAKQFLPEFVPLLPRYEQWAAQPDLSNQDRRSVESAVALLKGAQR